MSFSFFDNYFPSLSEIPASRAAATRVNIQTWLRTAQMESDTQPGSPFGDLHVTPLAWFLAACEMAMERVRSDIVLANPSMGVIYDCDFVRAYLGNFATRGDADTLYSYGTVRFIFTTDTYRELDRGLKLSFGAGGLFNLYLPDAGALTILPVGSPVGAGNSRVLGQISDSLYAVDVRVYGQMGTEILDGDAFALNATVPGLSKVQAVGKFVDAASAVTLSELAKRTRRTTYAASFSNRVGIQNLLHTQFPELSCVSPVMPGDFEQRRDFMSPLGLASGAVDVAVKSAQYGRVDTLTLRLDYDVSSRKFYGKLVTPATCLRLLSLSSPDASDVSFGSAGAGYDVVSVTRSRTLIGALAGGTCLEDLWLTVDMPADDRGDLVDMQVDAGGTLFAMFTVSVLTEPFLRPVHDFLVSAAGTPGVDIVARAFYPFYVGTLIVDYTRAMGTEFNKVAATADILSYLRNLTVENPFSRARLESALLAAGAAKLADVTFKAAVSWGAANKVAPLGSSPSDGVAAFLATATDLPAVTVRDIDALRATQYADLFSGAGLQTQASCGIRNLSAALLDSTLVLREVMS